MAAGITEHRALYLNSMLMMVLLSIACNKPAKKPATLAFVNADSAVIKTRGGITTVNSQVFSGKLFTISESDTVFTRTYSNGKEDGEWKEFYPAHELKEVRYFENGKKTGKYLAFWENGSKKLEYNFSNDEYHGSCREWLSNGALVKEMNYSYGHENGRQMAWYDNGKIRSNYTIVNGRRFGLLGTKNCRNVSDSIFNVH